MIKLIILFTVYVVTCSAVVRAGEVRRKSIRRR